MGILGHIDSVYNSHGNNKIRHGAWLVVVVGSYSMYVLDNFELNLIQYLQNDLLYIQTIYIAHVLPLFDISCFPLSQEIGNYKLVEVCAHWYLKIHDFFTSTPVR